MVFKVLLFAHRKPGLSPTEFRDYLESTHIPLLRRLLSATFPTSHARRYIHRGDAVDSDGVYPATVLLGSQADFQCDVISELTFENGEAFQAFFAEYQSDKVAAELKEDEARFLDAEKLRAVVIGEVRETLREGGN
ncbi:Dimeric alpha-beta barrel [Cordyceps fumosorosea ARSEF 2679]|uniref:Dimeric alpha-beta barrel n=1 Tax=Cordyceps fumosorosea (strain ARSEF 2679) TaxID=1081104 RepID=A0A167JSV5_CORFA|nr:Dimeric alpha-beta barrel [Cordyceps fumosorosea ARSEF 2679]OAA50706.1 Dimeric alpha-beta barrel [Cordyceps fumosorosea ARSEF 2679]